MLRRHRRRRRRKRDKATQSSARAVAHEHRVPPSEASSQEGLETWVHLTWMLRELTHKCAKEQ